MSASWLQSLRVCTVALTVISAAAGCSDPSVVVHGHVMIDGTASSGGRLSFLPVGDGPRAYSLVGEDGQFALRTSSQGSGAMPGSYRVIFRQPLSAKNRDRLRSQSAGQQLDLMGMSLSYQSPSDKPLVIPESGDENFIIDIRESRGWTQSFND